MVRTARPPLTRSRLTPRARYAAEPGVWFGPSMASRDARETSLGRASATCTANADFHAARSTQPWSGEFEVEPAVVPPGDGGVGWEVGLAQDG